MKLERMKVAKEVETDIGSAPAGTLLHHRALGLHIATGAFNTATDGKRTRLLVDVKTGELRELNCNMNVQICEGKISYRTRWETLPEGIVDDRPY